MGDKKNIDRLFQEKFKDFEAIPPAHHWKAIEAKLNQQASTSKRVFPLWWTFSGVAAALLIFLGIWSYFNNPPKNNKPSITNVEQRAIPALSNKKATTKKTEINNLPNKAVSPSAIENVSVTAQKPNVNSLKRASKNNSPLPNRKILTEEKSSAIADAITEKEKVNPGRSGNNQNSASISSTDIKTGGIAVAANENSSNGASSEEEGVTDNRPSILEAALEQQKLKENDVVENSSGSSKWEIGADIAPVYYSSISEGSPIAKEFADNKKSGNVNISYGVNLAYQLNKKLTIRSGAKKVNYGYNTNDIAFTVSGQSNINNSLALNSDPKLATASSSIKNALQPTPYVEVHDKVQGLSQAERINSFVSTTEYEGIMKQEFSYIEVPLEIEYNILNTKLGINIIGGFSSLFLTNQSVLLKSSDFETTLNHGNNINPWNFSTNIGLGFDYLLTKQFSLNVEPMFKYQWNTFSQNNTDFKPYTLGVSTGLSFKF
ncbi:outer membrane beta-barrel protein [Zhouia sp. PK063]|uniref:outer membrane beta-barrel protein n=1 Tax=Zhouia sp. PK063 TaxID=3373602 RepID=UPI00379F5EAC